LIGDFVMYIEQNCITFVIIDMIYTVIKLNDSNTITYNSFYIIFASY